MLKAVLGSADGLDYNNGQIGVRLAKISSCVIRWRRALDSGLLLFCQVVECT